jgi:hypothetical protein
MTRRYYEQPLNEEVERKAAGLLQKRLKCRIVKRQGGAHDDAMRAERIDWNMYRANRLWAIAEFKGKRITMREPYIKSGGCYFPKHKYDWGLRFARELHCHFFYFQWCLTGLYGVWLPVEHQVRKNTGQTRMTRDPSDIEDCVMIMPDQFKLLVNEPVPYKGKAQGDSYRLVG